MVFSGACGCLCRLAVLHSAYLSGETVTVTDLVLEATFPARLEQVSPVVAGVVRAAEGTGLAAEDLMHLELCVEEAVVNICEYAYPGGGGQVALRLWRDPGCVTVEISDNGEPFDPLAVAAPDTTQSPEERPIGGLGVFLIRELMDEIRYERVHDANVLTMVMHTGAATEG